MSAEVGRELQGLARHLGDLRLVGCHLSVGVTVGGGGHPFERGLRLVDERLVRNLAREQLLQGAALSGEVQLVGGHLRAVALQLLLDGHPRAEVRVVRVGHGRVSSLALTL